MNDFGDPSRELRWGVYLLLIAISTGAMLGRILAVTSVDVQSAEAQLYRQGRRDWQRQRPFLSANDRSRWATVRALVEHGTYAIDDVINERGWDTIDMVKHDGRDGEPHLYSSKPPLLATLMAGPYWVDLSHDRRHAGGASLRDRPRAAGAAERRPAGRLFPGAGAAGRAAGSDRLGRGCSYWPRPPSARF